jgi:hypothetical protein
MNKFHNYIKNHHKNTITIPNYWKKLKISSHKFLNQPSKKFQTVKAYRKETNTWETGLKAAIIKKRIKYNIHKIT